MEYYLVKYLVKGVETQVAVFALSGIAPILKTIETPYEVYHMLEDHITKEGKVLGTISEEGIKALQELYEYGEEESAYA